MDNSLPKTLLDMPEVAMKNILKYVNFRGILTLRKVCHDLRNSIEDLKPESHLEHVSISFNPGHIQLDMPFNIIMAKYEWNMHGAIVSYTGTKKSQRFLEDDFIELFLNDFKIMMSNQKTPIKHFYMYCKSKSVLEKLNVESCIFKTPVKSFNIQIKQQAEVLSILPYLDPKFLESVEFSSPGGTLDMRIEEVVELEQWKNLKQVNFHNLKIYTELQNFAHMTTVFFHWNWFSGKELIQMKEMFLNSPTLSSAIIHCKSVNKPQYDQALGQPLIGSSPFGTTQYHWTINDTERDRILQFCLSGGFENFLVSFKWAMEKDGTYQTIQQL